MEDLPGPCATRWDLMALGVLKAAGGRKIDVPGQLSVVGFDDIPQAGQWYPGLTTVRQPLRQMGHAGARLLIDQ
jgi:LacI family transcriptional regulator